MSRFNSIAGTLLALALACSAASVALPSEDAVWIRAETRNFTVFSDADTNTAEALASDLELLHSVLESLNRDRVAVPPVPTYVFIFRNEESFRPYKLRVGGKPAPISGYFLAHPHANFVAVDGSRGDRSRSVVFHEYIHYFVRHNLPEAPLWFNEGLAEFYSTFQHRGDEALIGMQVEHHVDWLRNNDLIPFAKFLETQTSSDVYNEKKRQGAFYAQSWALVHMFLTGDQELRENTANYLEALSDTSDPIAALEDAFDLSPRELERKLGEYVRNPTFSYFEQSLVGINEQAPLRPRRISRSEALYRLGYLLAHFNPARLAEANRHFDAALDVEADFAAAWQGLGYVQYLRGQHDAADYFYEKSRDLDGGDFLTHFLLGLNLTKWSLQERQLGVEAQETADAIARAQKALERSASLYPGFAETWATLGATYVGAPEVSERGAVVLEKAHALLPQRSDVTFNLAIVLARLGRRSEAARIIEGPLAQQADAQTVDRAREGLLLIDLRLADDLFQDGQLEGGLEIVEAVLAQTSDSTLFAQLSDKADEVRSILLSTEHQRLFDEAIDLAKKRRYDEAVARFEIIVDETQDPELRSAAKNNLKQMRRLR